ncbi:LamG domain-containing protein [bacterium AH-315-K03]|nr:LamG domain-containing protein [bacterium AH-315-K03]
MLKVAIKNSGFFGLMISTACCAADLLDDATITAIDAQLNSSSWAASRLIDHNHSTRWLSRKQNNAINFTLDNNQGAACFDSIELVNYGNDDRSVRQFALFKTLDRSRQSDTGTSGWIPIVADANPSGLLDYLTWAQGGRLVGIDSQLNSTSWAADNANDGDTSSRWLSRKSNNTLEYAFDTNWDGNTGDAISIQQIEVSNYGNDDRSLNTFQVEVTSDGSTWQKLTVPGSTIGEADFNFTSRWQGANLTDIDSQLNTTSWAAVNIHDGDNNTRWLSRQINNTLSFDFDVNNNGTSGAAGDNDDAFLVEKIAIRNYGTDDRSIREFQVEVKTRDNNQWQKIPVPGSTIGASDFNYVLALHGAQLVAIDGQLNNSSWAADNIHDGDSNSRWLSRQANNTLDFVFDVDLDNTTGADGDADDLFTVEKIYLQNYGVNDRSVRQFQVEVKTQSNAQWTKLQVPGNSSQAAYNFAQAAQGGRLDVIDSQLNNTSWAAANIHDGDANTRWLSNKDNNTLAFSFDSDLDGNTGDAINLDTVSLTNYGNDDRSIRQFEIDIQVAGGAWQPVNAPGGGTVFTANMNSSGQHWTVGPFSNVTAARLRTLNNHGDRNYIGARELVFSGLFTGPFYTFNAAMHDNGETFTLDTEDRPTEVTELRFRSISNHGDSNYTGAREFRALGTSITRNVTFTAAMHGNGETFELDIQDRPANVTEVRLLTISNHGDPNYVGAREFSVLGPSISESNLFSLPMSTGPHTFTLDNEDSVNGIIGARLITVSNHGDPNYTGLREFKLLGNPVGPSYIFEAQMDASLQTFTFQPTLGEIVRFQSINNYGDSNYTGAAELVLNSSTQCTYGLWHMDEDAWAGNSGEVRDSSGNQFHSTAINATTPNGLEPALGGDPGTCNYGELDGLDDHIELPASFPDLQNSFTISAWIYTDKLSDDSRIFVDDERNNNGFAFSLGDGGSGRLRFFSRRVSPVSVDTQQAVIRANTWHFVTAVHNSATRTREIYVDGVAQTLTGGSTAPSYNGTWGNDTGRASIGGETNNAGENNPRFRFRGRMDELSIHNSALSAAEISTLHSQRHSCSATPMINHFQINIGSSSASTCLPKTITVTACANADCSTTLSTYTGSITLSTLSSNGNWTSSGAGTLSATNNDDGNASYIFSSDDNGSATFDLSNSHAQTITVNVEDTAESLSSTSSAITFADNVFVISNDPVSVAGKDQILSAALWTNDGSNCAIATQYTGDKNLKAWLTRDVADPGGEEPSIQSLDLPNSLPGSNNLTALNFTAGEATLVMSTSDVGKYTLNLRDDSLLFADINIDGSSEITTRPFGFYLNVPSNPQASNAVGSTFIGAANNFTVTTHAVQWHADDDSNLDGIPDGHTDSNPATNADLSNNSLTPSFGAENNGQAETIVLTHNLLFPSGGAGVLDDSSSTGNPPIINDFSGGTGSTTTARFSEVGIIEISAALNDGSYLGSHDVIGASSYVGRFTPDHFVVQSPIVTAAGANHTYLGQTFTSSFELVARNASNTTTQNYTGNFLKISASDLNSNADYGAVDQTAATFMDTRTEASAHSISDASGVITIDNVDLMINKSSSAEEPFTNVQIGLDFSDGDGVEVENKNLDTTGDEISDKVTLANLPGGLRYGRVYIPPVYGPESPQNALIIMPFEIQYFKDNRYIVNTDDNSSTYNDWSWDRASNCSNLTLSCNSLFAGFTVTIPSTTSSVTSGRPTEPDTISITRPGVNNNGTLTLSLDVDSWLQFDWNNNGDENPSTPVTFGTYRGHDRIIYWRERHQ